MADSTEKTGLYERLVDRITQWVKPHLHKVSEKFIQKSIHTYAAEEPKFARMIEFEIRRRGDGAGLTQDVAEPILWTGIKTLAATFIAITTKSLESGKVRWIGYASALGLMLNNAIELTRVLPRYKAGLQGSLEMAKDRWQSLQTTGIDPFNQQAREINPGAAAHSSHGSSLISKLGITPRERVTPTSLTEQAAREPGAHSL